ncbi:molybdate ABC transporter substrate-binding protein [Thermomonas sp. HDW16]|uniref:molybdate ABC transporter substrate-binding protein n=1 Tax=Thermomonas sp. HDW16 TaxID=2714945 RepID=UPI00140DEC7C|nr:molybdate ABC transporter substrate-binding protein [Thermomonas sp. HDW16]QIL20312.1 molybdate ABC transporter substrate-binding protein [Thermomonas sp. HDW16]
MTYKPLLATIALLAGLLPGIACAQKKPQVQARVAVASNFADAARQLANDYARQSGHRIEISAASTGKLYAQIRNGAPFDAMLSADADTPRKLVAEGLADADTLHDYATGRLVLWSRDPALVKDGEALLRKGTITRLSIANPELAPYGEAAREALIHVRRWDELKPRLVMGENVGQAAQFVASGAAPLGLLPRSLVQVARKTTPGSGWDVPAAWHAPIVQSAVLLERGRSNAAARGFLLYLRSPAAQKKIRAFGYD